MKYSLIEVPPDKKVLVNQFKPPDFWENVFGKTSFYQFQEKLVGEKLIAPYIQVSIFGATSFS